MNMKLIMENFRKTMKEFKEREGKTMSYDSSLGGFVVSKEDLSKINQAIEKIYKAFEERTGGAAEEIPRIEVEDLEPVAGALNESVEQEEELTQEEKDKYARRFGYSSWSELPQEDKDFVMQRLELFTPKDKLRQKIGAFSGLEKGLGYMGPKDFEEGGYVLPVSREILDDFEKMVNELKEGGEIDSLFENTRDWYHTTRELLDKETENDKDATFLGLLIATYSPRTKVSLNLVEAAFMFKAVKMDAKDNKELLKEYMNILPGGKKKKQGEFRAFTNAHKLPNFALNVIAPDLAGVRDEEGEVNYNELYMWNSTIDTWMIDAFYPNIKGVSTSKEWGDIKGKMMSNVVNYRYMTSLVAEEARKLGLLPHELQAIVWVATQIRQTRDKSLGGTIEFATNQIKQSIVNLEKIKEQFGEEYREVAKKMAGPFLKQLDIGKEYTKQFGDQSWLKVILDKIESDGFEVAAEYVLGIKKAGKTVVPGIRSISASEPKGPAFRYFPEKDDKKDDKKDDSLEENKKKKKKEEKEETPRTKDEGYKDAEKYGELKTFYVMNNVIKMPSGKFNYLHDSVLLYLSDDFSKEKAVDYIVGKFNPEAKASKDYFIKESKRRFVIRILKS